MSPGPLIKIAHALRIAYHWKWRRSEILPYEPAEISIELTNRCNFKCSFCVQSDPEHLARVPATAISPDQVGLLTRKLRDGGVRTSVLHWTLDGEPFMNKGFAEAVAAAAAHGFNTHCFASNGYFVNPERLKAFPREGQQYVIAPDFCSDEEYFETYRGTEGSWQVVLDNLRAVLADPELDHFRFMINDISAFKIDDPVERDRRFAALRALFPEARRATFHRRIFHNMTGFLGEPDADAKYHLCPYPWESFTIASDGRVVACCRDLERQTVLGNLFEQDFKEIWNGAALQQMRRDLAEGHPERVAACAGCDMPWNPAKFSLGNIAKSAVHRVLIFRR